MSVTAELVRTRTEHWSPARRERAAAALKRRSARQGIVGAVSHPAELAKRCQPDYVITPAVELVSRSVEAVLRGRRRNLLVTAPPQEGKSTICAVWAPLRALQLHPNWRVMLLTYADGLAEEHSVTARTMIQKFGSGVLDDLTGEPLPDLLGLSLREDRASAGNWRIREGNGGLVAAGRDATITGRSADLLIIDDPFKNMQEADSVAMRHKVDAWYRSVASTRLSAGASTILIQTRWHPEDLAGTIITEQRELPPELRTWRYINIPAVAHPALKDALGREPGTPLESARGRTKADFQDIERKVGKRVWSALYQGSPTPPEGGLFSQEWFDQHRLEIMPERTLATIVAVDPAETGEGDEAGVLAASLLAPPSAAALTAYALMADSDAPPLVIPRVVFTHDRSGQMTSDKWAKAAVTLALDVAATEINVETYTAGTTYLRVVRTEISNRLYGRNGAKVETDPKRRAMLRHLLTRVRPWRGTGDAVARSGLLRQATEVGSAVMLGHEMARMEEQARDWQTGQHQPDRVAAAVIAHDRLVQLDASRPQMAPPSAGTVESRTPPAWLTRKVG